MPHTEYFVDVFGVHSKISGLTFKLGATKVVFNRTQPIELTDGKMESGKLARFDRRAMFVYKPTVTLAQTSQWVIPFEYMFRCFYFGLVKSENIFRSFLHHPMRPSDHCEILPSKTIHFSQWSRACRCPSIRFERPLFVEAFAEIPRRREWDKYGIIARNHSHR